MNKSPEFDMLKEPAEPEENTEAEEERAQGRKREGKDGGKQRVKMFTCTKQKCVRRVSFKRAPRKKAFF